jgi:hypothetical protein
LREDWLFIFELLRFVDSEEYTLVEVWEDVFETEERPGERYTNDNFPDDYRTATAEEIAIATKDWDAFLPLISAHSEDQMSPGVPSYMRLQPISVSPFSSLHSLHLDLTEQEESLFLLFHTGAFPSLRRFKVEGGFQYAEEGH